MKKKNKIDEEVLRDFLEEAEKSKQRSADTDNTEDKTQETTYVGKPAYKCPACHKMLYSRKEACPYCHYHGYIPMSEEETKRIRKVLFWIILAIAIAVFIYGRSR